jgi:hypothetical protein
MADVNVSVMADRTPTTVAIVRLRITGPTEGTDIFFRFKESSEMSESATTQEQIFRVVYASELKKKRDNELQDERRRVNYQEGKTPGRRGEMIMQDEISKETIRRYYLNRKGSKLNSDIRFNLRI